jgi:hypothetical protein
MLAVARPGMKTKMGLVVSASGERIAFEMCCFLFEETDYFLGESEHFVRVFSPVKGA